MNHERRAVNVMSAEAEIRVFQPRENTRGTQPPAFAEVTRAMHNRVVAALHSDSRNHTVSQGALKPLRVLRLNPRWLRR